MFAIQSGFPPLIDSVAYLLLLPIIQISVAIMRGQSIRLCDVTSFVFPYNDGVKDSHLPRVPSITSLCNFYSRGVDIYPIWSIA